MNGGNMTVARSYTAPEALKLSEVIPTACPHTCPTSKNSHVTLRKKLTQRRKGRRGAEG